jgi:glycosyltransferase involved in cell wall biosynthesis
MIWWKGVDVLMAAHQLLSARGNPVQLSLYGDADPLTHRAISRETLLEWGSRPHVTWHGSTSDVRAVWRDHDIAVIPSRRREGLPRTLLEAAACGRPVIVTDVPGSRHFVRDGVEGLIVPPEDPAALADAIARLASDPALRQRMGTAARDRILSGFTETHVMNAVAQTYENLFRTLPG